MKNIKIRDSKFLRQDLKAILIFGLLAALFANVRFNIPGVEGGISDAREIVALFSVVFLQTGFGAVCVGLIAALGGPYDGSLLNTILMHISAIPLAWFFLAWLSRKIKNVVLFALSWFLFILALYIFIYSPVFSLSALLTADVAFGQLSDTYLAFLRGVRFEAVITAAITALAISFIYLRRKLEEESSKLEMALEGAGLGLWNWNIEQGQKTYNERWAQMLGYSLSEFKKNNDLWEELVHPDDRETVQDILQKHLKGESPVYEAEYRLRTKQGDWKWISDRGRIVARNESGKPLRMSGTHLDITERKRSEDEKRKLQAQLMQSQKMEAVGVLAGGVAHDFNNLLTVISGHSELALMKTKNLEKVQKDILAIQKAAKRAENLTSQLLAFSRKQIYNPAIIDMNQVVKQIDQMIRRLIGEDILIEEILAGDLPSVKADPVQLEQMLINLLVNARDAINAKTEIASQKKIIIETHSAFLDAYYVKNHPGCEEGLYVILSVSDSGVGMDRETKEKIFEPFFSTKEQGKGTGLGLSMVYGIVKQNKGYIGVYSEPGRGTTFKINWPASNEALSEMNQRKTVKINSLSGTESILLVEDDQAVRNFAASALKSLGYTVFEAGHGKEALQMLQRKQVQPDLLITDLIMPEMNGKELARKVQQISPSLQILFTSGYTENHIVRGGSLERGIQFIVKPYSISGLAQKVREVLDGSLIDENKKSAK